MNSRLAAMETALAAGLPVPALVRRAPVATAEAVLLSWLPGTPMYDALVRDGWQTRRWGELAGAMQRRLHAIEAPEHVIDALSDEAHPFNAGRGVDGLPEGSALLHLDWHPLNLLIDAEQICGIVDWDNARRGHPLLDVARTLAMLTVEPTLATLPIAMRERLDEFRRGWADGYGLAVDSIPDACKRWAGRVMLADLKERYVDAPALLEPLRTWTAAAS